MQNLTATSLQPAARVQSIDVLRGIVMIIMALDHTRDFFHWSAFQYDPTDFSKTSTLIFMTRWITHFCAPIFVFLAGTSAYLTCVRKGKKALSIFLFTRGLWLIFIEITVINFAFSFNIDFNFIALQVIWALGVGMIFLSFMIYLPKRLLLVVALFIIAGHNLLDNVHVKGESLQAVLWAMLHEQQFFSYGKFNLLVLYPVLPWIGLMCAGYCFGELYSSFDADKRKRILIIIGSICIVLFIALRFTNWYGDPSSWKEQNSSIFTALSFINTTKYPPSLLYILMTIGPSIFFLAFIEKPLNRLGNIVSVYGRVPMFYYILHFYFIHFGFILAAMLIGYTWEEAIVAGPVGQRLENYGFSLPVVYLVWLVLIIILYPLCKWYDRYKTKHKEKWWLSYL